MYKDLWVLGLHGIEGVWVSRFREVRVLGFGVFGGFGV